MKSFVVLIVGKNLNSYELEIALRSFAGLVSKVTPKHRKALQFHLIEDSQQNLMIKRLIERFRLEDYVDVHSHLKASLTECDVLFSPTLHPDTDLLTKSLCAGVPVITYDNNESEEYIDSSCGVLLPYRSGDRAIQEFSDYLKMLYFDPEAQRFLQKGAVRRSQRKSIQLPTASLSMAS